MDTVGIAAIRESNTLSQPNWACVCQATQWLFCMKGYHGFWFRYLSVNRQICKCRLCNERVSHQCIDKQTKTTFPGTMLYIAWNSDLTSHPLFLTKSLYSHRYVKNGILSNYGVFVSGKIK